MSDIDQLRTDLAAIRKERDDLLFQNAAGLASAETFLAIARWLETDPIKPAAQAFTAGPERQIAYMIERDVLPMLHSLREENNSLKAEVEALRLNAGVSRV